jgi:hypothetical protein
MTKVLEYVELETRPWVDDQSPPADDIVWRFTMPTEFTPKDIDAIPSVRSVSFTPATISLGENLGTRASLTITFQDHKHIFNGEPFDQGTFFAKWRGRYLTRFRGRPVRWIRGVLGQSLAEMETWHFVAESVSGPTPDGAYTLVAQDILKLADDDRALAPRPTRGFLVAPIDTDDTAATMGPTGIGNIDYSASGFVAIAGKEVASFTRSGDALTITRALAVPGTTYETEVVEHDAGARVQQCLAYLADDPADIIYDLLTTFGGVDPSYIDLAAWQTETATYLQTLYTGFITEPTGVNKLVSELIEQASLAVWWDAIAQTVRLQVLRPVSTASAVFSEDKFLARSLKTQEQPGKRISEVLFYYGLREPLRPIDEDDNYRAIILTTDPTAGTEYGGVVTKTIKSRWVPFGAGQTATRASNNLLGRFRDPPRRVNFDTWRFAPDVPELGGGYQFGWTENTDKDGIPALAPIQVTRLNPSPEKYAVEAEEVLFTFFDQADLANRVITIPSNINNVNLREMHDTIYPPITEDDLSASPPVTVTCVIADGVIVGSTSTSLPAFDVGDWLIGFTPLLQLNGRIQGKGGNGASADTIAAGQAGGVALFSRHSIDVEYGASAEIWGGAGGGGMSIGSDAFGGGGGAGQLPGSGGSATGGFPGSPGTTDDGGDSGTPSSTAGDGGDPGQPGNTGAFGFVFTAGGAAGSAIDGVSFVNVVSGSADVRGATVN